MSWYRLLIFRLFIFSLRMSTGWWQRPSIHKRDNRRILNWAINSEGRMNVQLRVWHLQPKRLCAKGESFNFNNSKHNDETHRVSGTGGNHFQLLRFIIKLGTGWGRKSSNIQKYMDAFLLLLSTNLCRLMETRINQYSFTNETRYIFLLFMWSLSICRLYRRSPIWIPLGSYLWFPVNIETSK
jgi:hypothetical protein